MYIPIILLVATVVLLIGLSDWFKELKLDPHSYFKPSGILGALFFLAVGVFFLFQEHSRIASPELLFNSVLFFVFVPIAFLRARRTNR